jgi:thiol-disulfide isomerase/thioredoxin
MKKIFVLSTLFATALTLFSFVKLDDSKTNRKVGTNIGDIAPDMEFEDPDGKKLSLSSLRGKVVLIDFWASWCGPCRRENPNIVRAYNKYSEAKFKTAKGFEIYSVSLDKNKGRWLSAIKMDKLDWKYHVSDLKAWQSEAARLYGVRSIPTNYLINEEGVIIGKGLRGTRLDIAIDKEVKAFK